MSKAEEIHYKAVIAADNQEPPKDYCISAQADHFNGFIEGYIEGYHQAEEDLKVKAQFSSGWDGFYYGQGYQQAEKDLELTWEDMRIILDAENDILREYNSQKELVIETYPKEEDYYGEVLKRFKDYKERNEK